MTLGAETEIVIERHKFDPAGWSDTLITLVGGAVQGTANSAYVTPDSEFRIVTPTAQVRVFGTEFAVEYSAQRAATDVFGLRGRLGVRSSFDPTGEAVFVSANEATRVKWGAAPEPPYRTDWILSDLLSGTAREVSVSDEIDRAMWPANPVLSGSVPVAVESVNPPRAWGFNPGGGSIGNREDVSTVLGQPPSVMTGPGRAHVGMQDNGAAGERIR
jgi:hypothetical protein